VREPTNSSPYSEEPDKGSYSEPNESTPHPPQLISLKSILIPSSHPHLGLSSDLFYSGFPTKTLYFFLSSSTRATFSLIWQAYIWGWVQHIKVSHGATSSILLLLHPSLVQIFSLEPCSQTPSVYAHPSMWEIKFHTHTKPLAELFFQTKIHYLIT
jgi:hypothetical protein